MGKGGIGLGGLLLGAMLAAGSSKEEEDEVLIGQLRDEELEKCERYNDAGKEAQALLDRLEKLERQRQRLKREIFKQVQDRFGLPNGVNFAFHAGTLEITMEREDAQKMRLTYTELPKRSEGEGDDGHAAT